MGRPSQSTRSSSQASGQRSYSRERIYASRVPSPTSTVEQIPVVSRHLYFNDSDLTCATVLRADVDECLPLACDPMPSRPKPAFSVHSTYHKGLGMFARKTLPAASVISVEHPLIIVAKGSGDASHCMYPMELGELGMLANTRRRECFSEFEGLLETNAVDICLPSKNGPPVEHSAIFLELSRCNHSCSPNAYWKWDAKTFTSTLRAARPIEKGEEITIQYIDSCISYRQRRDKLASRYGFTCICSTCTAEDHAASDAARSELRRVLRGMPRIEAWCDANMDMSDDHLIRMAERALELREQEGLQLGAMSRHMEDIALCYGALKDEKMFKHWMEKASELRTGEYRIVMVAWAEDPANRCPFWGWRT
ncbi:SET domain-containing protein [Cylindrobasidium torrendii FP15055 ss-10]|uniref:SET domain-containing protein n=1 Tax=Cylindrobasidium torrendii FP15055 ss-10 TaxID=1314674 RepID=A0A0D7BID5_9AGAR|nr:SET domain-containing protein [Cylindrobasidium torrendii FP15055 ss-10]